MLLFWIIGIKNIDINIENKIIMNRIFLNKCLKHFNDFGDVSFGKLDIKNEKLERKFNGVVYSYRPKSLQGIENNNGWIKIESEKDLPKEKGLKCLFLCIHGNTTCVSDDVLEDPKWFANKYSHWRLKDEIKDPIY